MNTSQSLRDMLKFGSTAFGGILALDQGFFGQQGMAASALHGASEGTYENGEYRLPALPYDYNALEPLYDEKTLRIHHGKHHAAYVKGLNEELQKLEAAYLQYQNNRATWVDNSMKLANWPFAALRLEQVRGTTKR